MDFIRNFIIVGLGSLSLLFTLVAIYNNWLMLAEDESERGSMRFYGM